MKVLVLTLAFILGAAPLDFAQQTTAPPASKAPPKQATAAPQANAALQKKVEAFLRNIYAWGPAFHVKVGEFRETPIPGLSETSVEVSYEGQSDSTVIYVSKDGRFVLRGELQDMTVDPMAATRKQINLANSPSLGPQDAKVVIVEYGDFQCPTCRQLHTVLKQLLPKYPQVRLVFKDFPLTQIHPWAMTAALAARCAYKQNAAAFWPLHDRIYESQDLISPANAWDKMFEFAASQQLDPAAFRSCMSDAQTPAPIEESLKEGLALRVANTPTLFVNGRRFIGADAALLEQLIQFELSSHLRP